MGKKGCIKAPPAFILFGSIMTNLKARKQTNKNNNKTIIF
jgi:hypothetical protein